jgi:hypothetical protein
LTFFYQQQRIGFLGDTSMAEKLLIQKDKRKMVKMVEVVRSLILQEL